jgi:exopolyphosphatase/guanosine-5'-triphosphate,3'-diphosphate pyrophosphatase
MSARVADPTPHGAPAGLPWLDGGDVAVVDVGSNSVRLVIYRLEGRAIWTVHNEKVLAGLGRDLADTGRLSPEGTAAALAALRRFRAVVDGVRPKEVYAAATAAVREAADGPAFIDQVRAEAGFQVRVLSGEEEARASAMGVIAGAPDATGVVGDLGGSSLELIRIAGGRVEDGLTLPLGPFALQAGRQFDAARSRAEAVKRLAPVAEQFRAPVFHCVGGAWRNLALLQMRTTRYPLHVVHQYELTSAEALNICRLVARQSRGSLERIPGMSKRRSETLPHAAVLLETLVEQLRLERVVFSAYGLREGLLFDAMAPGVRDRDPLLEGCAAFGARFGAAEDLFPALEAWLSAPFATLDPVFSEGRDATLLSAACRLADIGARLHPDHRGELAFDQVLRAPLAGQTHAERAFLATAIHTRYESQPMWPQTETVERVLSPERLHRARALGMALRLGCDLSGRSPPLLAKSTLTLDKRRAVLSAHPAAADLLLGEQTRKRLGALADHLELEPVAEPA